MRRAPHIDPSLRQFERPRSRALVLNSQTRLYQSAYRPLTVFINREISVPD